jgi:hypothetical protein
MYPRIPPHHILPRWQPSIVNSNAAVSESGDEDVARYLVAGHGGEAGVGAGGEVLFIARTVSEREKGKSRWKRRKTNLENRFPRRVPHPYKLHIPTHQQLSPSLLPLDDQPRILLLDAAAGRSGDGERLGDALEGGDELDFVGRFVASEEADVAVG